MARLILDTTSVLIKAERGGGELLESLDDVDDVAIAAITVAELRVGVSLSRGRRRAKREHFIASVLGAISVETYDLEAAAAHAELLAHVSRAGRHAEPTI